MKNGLNVGAISEMVHEILAVPAEAIVRYDAATCAISDGEYDIAIKTIRAGTVRIGRRFALRASRRARSQRSLTTRQILAAGLSGCVMITFVQGSSARGVSLNKVRVELTLLPAPDADGCTLRYRWLPDCDATREQLTEVCHQVACFSPNHRTAIEPNYITVKVMQNLEDPDSVICQQRVVSLPALKGQADVSPVSVVLDWQYGTQCRGRFVTGDAAVSPQFEVDQAKQYSGLDKGLNPQEFLLSALSAEVRAELERMQLDEVVRAQGKVDIRGLLNVIRGAEVRVHDVDVLVKASQDVEASELLDQGVRALGRSRVAHLICEPQKVRVEIAHEGGAIEHFFSDLTTRDGLIAKFAPKTGK